jgi:hypothetical protein
MDTAEQIDEKIAMLERKIVRLKTRRNATVPLCRLPTELLVRILLETQNRPSEDEMYSYGALALHYPSDGSYYNPKWIIIVRVCKHIHDVARNARVLWSFFKTTEKHGMIRFGRHLQLAGNIPLTLWIRSNYPSDDEWLASWFLPNVRSAYLEVTDRMPKIMEALNAPIPHAYSLRLKFEGSTFPVTPTFIGGCCDKLTYLALQNITIREPPPLPALIRLHIDQIQDETKYKALSALLCQTPRLEVLSVSDGQHNHDASKPTHHITTVDIHEIELPALRVVEAESQDVQLLYALLHMIPAPAKRLSAINLGKADKKADTGLHHRINQLWQKLSGNQSATLPNGVATATKTALAAHDWQLSIGTFSYESPLGDAQAGQNFHFSAQGFYGRPDGTSVYLPDVRTLRLSLEHAYLLHTASWTDAFTSLHTIVLTGAPPSNASVLLKGLLSWCGKRVKAGLTVDTIEFAKQPVPDKLGEQCIKHRISINREKMPVVNRVVAKQEPNIPDKIWIQEEKAEPAE